MTISGSHLLVGPLPRRRHTPGRGSRVKARPRSVSGSADSPRDLTRTPAASRNAPARADGRPPRSPPAGAIVVARRQDGSMPAISPARTQPMDGFSAPTRAWFSAAFAEPTPAQVQAWAAIGQGDNALVVAPTGSGKTLAAFLWAIDKLATGPIPEDPLLRCRVLYISPLKALAVDIERNLRSPLTGVGHAAHRLGLGINEI